jgi:hypothetical protein
MYTISDSTQLFQLIPGPLLAPAVAPRRGRPPTEKKALVLCLVDPADTELNFGKSGANGQQTRDFVRYFERVKNGGTLFALYSSGET